jgi:O-antigen ligase
MQDRRGLFLERLACGAIALLPLACWPGIEHPFVSPKLCLLAVADVTLAVRCLLPRPHPGRPAGASDWWWLLWLAAVAVSALAAPYVSMDALWLLVLPAPLAIALDRDLISSERLCRAVIVGSTCLCAIAVLQYAGADPLRWLGWVPEAFANPRMRVYGTLGNPDFVAAWCAGALPLVLAWRQPDRLSKLVYWVIAALHLGAMAATGSRVFLLAAPAAAVAMIARRAPVSRWWLAAAAVTAAILVWISPARPLGTTVDGRLYLTRVSWSGWCNIPLTGHGPGSFEVQFAQRQAAWLEAHPGQGTAFAGAVDHAHNDYLEMLIELGPVGMGAFLALAGALVWSARRVRDDVMSPFAWAGAASLAAVALVDFPFHRPAEWTLLWILLGTISQSRIARKD